MMSLEVLRQAWRDWNEDHASRLAAALAYYTAISLAPMIVLGVMGLDFLGVQHQQVIEEQMGQLMGDAGREMATQMIQSTDTTQGWLAGSFSFAVLLWGASNVFAQLQDSLNTLWEVQPRPGQGWVEVVKKRFLSFAMVLGIGFLLLTSLVVSAVLAGVSERLAGEATALAFALDTLLTIAFATGFFAAVFKLLPDVVIAWRDVIGGALFTAVAFTVGKHLLALYLAQGSTASAYGAAGSLAAVLIWVYYSAQIMFFGAELTQARADKLGREIVPARGAVPILQA
jgi:membrane protein